MFENVDTESPGRTPFVFESRRIAHLNRDGWSYSRGGFPSLIHQEDSRSQVAHKPARNAEGDSVARAWRKAPHGWGCERRASTRGECRNRDDDSSNLNYCRRKTEALHWRS